MLLGAFMVPKWCSPRLKNLRAPRQTYCRWLPIGSIIGAMSKENWTCKGLPEGPRTIAGTWVRVSGGGLPCSVSVRLEDRHGRTVATDLLLESAGEIGSDLLRAIPVGRVIDAAIRCLPRVPGEGRIAATDRHRISPPRGRRRIDNDELVVTAEVYREALRKTPRTPVKGTAERLGMSRATVHRYLAKARERGFLEASEGR